MSPTPSLVGCRGYGTGEKGFYRDYTKHPELSHQEFETARKVSDQLRGCGFEVHDGIGGTGRSEYSTTGRAPEMPKCFAPLRVMNSTPD